MARQRPIHSASGSLAILVAMAFTPGELATELHVSVLALALAVVAYLILDTRRKTRGTRPIAVPPPAD